MQDSPAKQPTKFWKNEALNFQDRVYQQAVLSVLEHFESQTTAINNIKVLQLQELFRRLSSNKIEGFRNLLKSYPEYQVEDEKKIKFIKRIVKRNSENMDGADSSKNSA